MILLLAGCEADSPAARPGSMSPPVSGTVAPTAPCATARIEFGPTYKYDVLTAGAPAVTIVSASGGPVDTALRPVRRYRAEVVTEGELPQREVYRAFVDSFGDPKPLPEFGEVAPTEPITTSLGGFEPPDPATSSGRSSCDAVVPRPVTSASVRRGWAGR